jgi:hypothetical protein
LTLGPFAVSLPDPVKGLTMIERLKTVFHDHKTEMLIAAATGFLVGQLFF